MLRTDDRDRVHSEPSLEERGVQLSEIDRRLQVPSSAGLRIAEVEQRWVFAVASALHVVADHERNAARTVIGAERAVHLRSTSELGVDHDGDPTAVRRGEQREELIQRVIDVHPEAGVPFDATGVGLALVLVGVEATGIGMDHPCTEVCADEVRGHRELTLETGRARDDPGVGIVDHRSEVERGSAQLGPIVAESAKCGLLGHRSNGHRGTLVTTRRRRPEAIPLPR